jgi:MFS family permease
MRHRVEASPVFLRKQQRHRESTAPLGRLFRHPSGAVLRSALTFVANNAAGYLLIAFFISYGQKTLHLPASQVLSTCTLAAASWLVFTLAGGLLADRIGRVRTFQLGYLLLALWAIPMWFLIDSGSIALFMLAAVVLTILLGLSYGPQAALYAEMFPAKVRYSGVSVGYALGSILGGAFAATIAQWIIASTGQSWLIGVYLIVLCAVSGVAVSWGGDRAGVDLEVDDADPSSQSWAGGGPARAGLGGVR